MNPVNYFEIGGPDAAAARTFYSGLLGWKFADSSIPGYQMVNDMAGGLFDTSSMGGGTWAIFYVQVDDVKATIEKAEKLGAKLALPVTDGGGIEFAHLIDPQGNRFGIWKPAKQ